MTLLSLSISIVTYRPDPVVLGATLRTLAVALSGAAVPHTLYLVDNDDLVDGPARGADMLDTSLSGFEQVERISGHGNVGYGRGHNLAITRSTSAYHLVLNPDVELSPDALMRGLAWMERHADFGVIAPCTTLPSGELQYLCRRYPSLWVLFLRGFAPPALQRRSQAALDQYQMKIETDAAVVFEPPIISGCFMLFRTTILKQLGGFEPRFFLYFEDYDLSLRAAALAKIGYLADMRIVHYGGHAATKGLDHTLMFIRSAVTFFNLHGWKFR